MSDWLRRLTALDAAVARYANRQARRHARLRQAVRLAATGLAPAEIVLMAGLAVAGERRAAARMLLAVGLIYVTGELIGRTVQRARPFESDDVEELVGHDAGRSFPSRHVASALAMAAIGGDVRPGWGRMMATMGWVGGASRVAAGVHYPSDVLAGALLGELIATVCVRSPARSWKVA